MPFIAHGYNQIMIREITQKNKDKYHLCHLHVIKKQNKKTEKYQAKTKPQTAEPR